MLNKNQSNKRNSWKYAVILPLLGAFVFFFQVKVIAQEKESVKTEIKSLQIDKTNLIITKNTTDEEIKQFCEQLKKVYNIDLTFFNIKRNSNGEIINIESKFKDKTGSGSSKSESDNTPIKPFKFFYDDIKKETGYIMDMDLDLASLSKGKEIYINGKKSSQEQLDKLDPNEIEKVDVIKKSDNPKILVTTKHLTKPVKFTDKDIYINGVKSDKTEMDKLNPDEIATVDVIKNNDKQEIRIITQKHAKMANDNAIYINDKKVTQNDLDKLDQNTIETMDINKESGKSTIKIRTKKGSNIPDDTEILVNGKKISKEEMDKLDTSTIESIDVTKNGISQNTIKIITRKTETNDKDQAKKAAEQAKIASEQAKKDTQQAKIDAEQAKWDAEQAKKNEEAKKRK